MSRPRRPFGNDHPGRVASTMIKVLAAEMSDAGRLSRGKRLWSDDAVIDLVVGHGVATAEVQGSQPDPYVVTLEPRPGHQAPTRSEMKVWCTCADDDGSGRFACKHAVAALFALADEVLIEPAVLARWRRSSEAPGDAPGGPPSEPDDASSRTSRRAAPTREPDPLEQFLGGANPPLLPPLPDLPEAPAARFPDPLVAEVLADALHHLQIRWE